MASWRDRTAQALSAILPWSRADGAGGSEDRQVFISSACIGPRQHVILLMDERGEELGRIPLAARGHDIAIDPSRRKAVVFARRPGYFAVVVDIASCTALATITPQPGHHFFGHGVFSADGRLLYATENDFRGERSRGVIGIYDATGDYARIGEFETHGLDAHELLLSPDGQLIVANGGIETHPEFGRQKLNLADMRPSIVHIDPVHGDCLAETVLSSDLNRLSMRHMTFDRHGDIWFGCQWEGDRSVRPPLVGRLGRDGNVMLLSLPDTVAPLARNYIGSVVASRDGSVVATSSPVGGTVFLWDVATASLKATMPFKDGCGLSGHDGANFVATSGDGRIVEIDAGTEQLIARRNVQFDNHLRRI